MMSMIDIIVLFLYKRKYNNYNMKNLAKYIRESKSDIDGKKFDIDANNPHLKKLPNPDITPFIKMQQSDESGPEFGPDGPDGKHPYFTDKYFDDVSDNLTLMTTAIDWADFHKVKNAFNRIFSEKTKISILDFGWDYHINEFDRTCSILMGWEDRYSPNDYDFEGDLVTYNFFDYYNEVVNDITNELEKIFGFAQECYLGKDATTYYCGFDVQGGSILLALPMFNAVTFEITTDETRPGDDKAIFKPTSFYGPDDTHFYNTRTHRCACCEADLRLD